MFKLKILDGMVRQQAGEHYGTKNHHWGPLRWPIGPTKVVELVTVVVVQGSAIPLQLTLGKCGAHRVDFGLE